jgi:hypothetical protein
MTTGKYPLGILKFSKDAIDKMKKLSEETKIIERGASICYDISKDNHILEIEDICKGDKCSIRQPLVCNNKNKLPIGFFHTHPNSTEPDPSCADMLSLGISRIMCIGTPNKKLACFAINPEYDNRDIVIERQVLDICKEQSDQYKKGEEEYSERLKIWKNLIPFTEAIQKRFTIKFNPEDYMVN